MKKVISAVMAGAMALGLVACGGQSASSAPAASSAAAGSASAAGKTYTVGICQLVQHPALDAATQGFKDALTEKLGDAVKFDEQNANGDAPTAATICNGFVASNVDLILANATAPLQSAAAATSTIPVLGTSITDYATALSIDDWTGVVGGNISGTSDLAPLDEQAAMLNELFPDAKNVGILYCSAEANSKYQSDVVTAALEKLGYTVNVYTFSDSNDVASVTQTACEANDVLYIPTDNTAASNMTIISGVCELAGIPVVCGEEGMCSGGGLATVSISYYDIGVACSEMAYEILVNGADITTMPVGYSANPVKKYNADYAAAIGFTMPEGYEAIG